MCNGAVDSFFAESVFLSIFMNNEATAIIPQAVKTIALVIGSIYNDVNV